MVDEASLLSCELTVEIDAALRIAKENPNEWFGGIMIMFSEDFYQYPPVAGTALLFHIMQDKQMKKYVNNDMPRVWLTLVEWVT